MTSTNDCITRYGTIDKKNIPKSLIDIENFCGLLRANKVKESQTSFLKLPFVVQCLFLNYSWKILSQKDKCTEDSYRTAFYLFKLFRSKELKAKPIYSRYVQLKDVEMFYKKALEFNRENKPEGKSSSSSTSRSRSTSRSPKTSRSSNKYDKNFQKKPSPTSDVDPLFIFYTSLYTEKPNSPLAITWLTEHGVFDGKERTKIETQYKKLAEKNLLIH